MAKPKKKPESLRSIEKKVGATHRYSDNCTCGSCNKVFNYVLFGKVKGGKK